VGQLRGGILVYGELYVTDATVKGLGKITTKGEEELKEVN
jgi:hypothetical protein